MKTSRAMPPLNWTAVSWGLLVALVAGLVLLTFATALAAPLLGFVAPTISCGFGGFLAGKRAKRDGAYHGGVVGAAWIAFELFGLVPTVVGGGLGTAEETIAIIVSDLVLILSASIGGSLATRG